MVNEFSDALRTGPAVVQGFRVYALGSGRFGGFRVLGVSGQRVYGFQAYGNGSVFGSSGMP